MTDLALVAYQIKSTLNQAVSEREFLLYKADPTLKEQERIIHLNKIIKSISRNMDIVFPKNSII